MSRMGMGFEMSPRMNLGQHQIIAPKMIQSMEILQLPIMALQEKIQAELQENPFLELKEARAKETETPAVGEFNPDAPIKNDQTGETEFARMDEINRDWGDHFNEEHRPSRAALVEQSDKKLEAMMNIAQAPQTLQDHLAQQLPYLELDPDMLELCEYVIAHLDENGYLTQSLEEIAAMLPSELAVEPIELTTALRHLQNLDPLGVGARDLGECLTLQLAALPADTPYLEEALSIAKHHLNLLAAHDFFRLKKLLRCDDEALRATQSLITRLNPRPGSAFANADTRYIQHDVEVKKIKGHWVASLNPEVIPRLRINRLYAEILRRNRDSGGLHLSSQMQEAKWMIKNIQQRFDTILRVSQAISRETILLSCSESAVSLSCPLRWQRISTGSARREA